MENKKGISIYKQVAKEIECKVKNGIYVTAQKLPSEAELAQEFNVSRLTVRKAINLLIEKKVLVKHQNTGTYVMNRQKLASGASGLQGFNEVAKAKGKTPRTEVIGVSQIDYDDELFPEAAKVVVSTGTASVSMLQRHFKIGYARAGRLIDLLERARIIGPHLGSKSRDVLATREDLIRIGVIDENR